MFIAVCCAAFQSADIRMSICLKCDKKPRLGSGLSLCKDHICDDTQTEEEVVATQQYLRLVWNENPAYRTAEWTSTCLRYIFRFIKMCQINKTMEGKKV